MFECVWISGSWGEDRLFSRLEISALVGVARPPVFTITEGLFCYLGLSVVVYFSILFCSQGDCSFSHSNFFSCNSTFSGSLTISDEQ